MADRINAPVDDADEDGDDNETYEILPEKEIDELKREVRNLKDFEITPTKKIQVSVVELNAKLDRMLAIFEEAMHGVELGAGSEEGISAELANAIKELSEKLDKIIEQNKDIAEGIVAVADIVKSGSKEVEQEPEATVEQEASLPPQPPQMPRQMPPMPRPPSMFTPMPPRY